MKIKLLSLLMLVGIVASAQSLTVVSVDTAKAKGNAVTSVDLEAHAIIRNNSSSDMDVMVKRIDKGYNDLTDANAICWYICGTTSDSESLTFITIPAGQESSTGDFIGHVYPDGDDVSRRGGITYVFYDMNNPTDSVSLRIYYQTYGTVGIEEASFDDFSVYPNPATSVLNVSYSGMKGDNVTFELMNMVGSKVYSRDLSTADDQFKLDISKLSRGVYFYVVKSNGVVSSSKKLVIK